MYIHTVAVVRSSSGRRVCYIRYGKIGMQIRCEGGNDAQSLLLVPY